MIEGLFNFPNNLGRVFIHDDKKLMKKNSGIHY